MHANARRCDAILVHETRLAKCVGKFETHVAFIIREVSWQAFKRFAANRPFFNDTRGLGRKSDGVIAVYIASTAVFFRSINALRVQKVFIDCTIAVVIHSIAALDLGQRCVANVSINAFAGFQTRTRPLSECRRTRPVYHVFVDCTVAIIIDTIARFWHRGPRRTLGPSFVDLARLLARTDSMDVVVLAPANLACGQLIARTCSDGWNALLKWFSIDFDCRTLVSIKAWFKRTISGA